MGKARRGKERGRLPEIYPRRRQRAVLEKVIEEIQKRACSECPAAEYCKNSPLNFCTEVLYAWAKEEAL